MNVHIHSFQPGGAVADEAALEQFQKQWATYQKLVDTDALSHKALSRSPFSTSLAATPSEPSGGCRGSPGPTAVLLGAS